MEKEGKAARRRRTVRRRERKGALVASARAREILGYLRRFGVLSRSDLAERMDLSGVSIGTTVRELLKEGWVEEAGEGRSSGGRRPVLLRLRGENGYIIGLDVGSENLRGVVTDLNGEIRAEFWQETESWQGREVVFGRMVGAAKELMERAGIGEDRLLGIGLGFSGMIDAEEGICLVAPNLPGWQGVAVAKELGAALGKEVKMDDSSRLKLLAERQLLWPAEMGSTFLLDLGCGIGGAFWVGGKIHRGLTGTAGELGHVVMEPEGPLCHCGSRGCLEALAAGPAIAAQAREGLRQGVMSLLRDLVKGELDRLTAETVVEAARRGDKFAFGLIEAAGSYIGSALAKVLNLLNPTQVILAGGLAKMGDLLLAPLVRTLRSQSLPMAYEKVKISLSQAGDMAAARGAALFYLDHFFADFTLKTAAVWPEAE